MKTFALSVLAISLLLCQNSLAYADGETILSAYKVTSYNLGTVSDNHDGGTSRYLTDFKPLMITSTASDVLNSEHIGRVSLSEAITPTSNVSGVALFATFDTSQKISLQGVFGVTRNPSTSDLRKYVNESSWEANLGVIYKLLNNLSYELHFGYMDTGTLFHDRSSYTNVESIIMISNQLTMSF